MKLGQKDKFCNLLDKMTNGFLYMLILCIIVLSLHFGRRIFIAESFIIPSESMEPTFFPGDRIWVNKILFGARLYTSFDFKEHVNLKSVRIPGIRDIIPGDVICFNYPHGYDNPEKIEFKINYVYCKRVLGTPGDRIGAVDGHYWNDGILQPIGVLEEQNKLRWFYDSIFVWNNSYFVFPQSDMSWNIKNWGPIVVPATDMTVTLDDNNREIYRTVIEYELGKDLDISVTEHTFCNNYYFAVGDNVMLSNDSRYWGFIPEDFIIGIVGGRKVRNNPNQTY